MASERDNDECFNLGENCNQQCYVLTNNTTSASNHDLRFSTSGMCSIDDSNTIDSKCKPTEIEQLKFKRNRCRKISAKQKLEIVFDHFI